MHAARKTNETGLGLGLLLIAVLVGLLIAALAGGIHTGPLKADRFTLLLGVYLMAWGSMFLASYWLGHKTFFFRALLWVCERFSRPASRLMALVYGALGLVMGGVVALTGCGVLPPDA